MASRSEREGLTDQLSSLQAEAAYCSKVASSAKGARLFWAQSRKTRIQRQIEQLEARRLEMVDSQA